MKVLIAGGGTAGHINPGLAIAKEIQAKNPESEIIFVGTQKGLENELVPKEGFPLKFINVKGFKRKLSIDTFVTIKELFKGLYQAQKIIKEFNPDIVIGTGGYVCGPVLLNASLMGIPTAIHEQNAYPGITNKILSRFVDAVMISFEESTKYFGKKNIFLTGNPVRKEIVNTDREKARQKLGLKEEKLMVVFGGSLGAEKINNAIIEYIKNGIGLDIRMIFGTGKKGYESVCNTLNNAELKNVTVVPYIENMDEVMSAADLVVCRAGAITLAELTVIGTPAILIPSPNVTHNHQEYNARALQREGAAEVLLEKDIANVNLKKYIEDILKDSEKLNQMSKKSKALGKIDATKRIYEIIIGLINKN